MNYRKQGLRALALSFLAVLGLMAFVAGGAQANWLVLHPKTGKLEEPDVTLNAKAHKEGVLLVKEETNLEILCEVIESDPTAPILLLEKSTVAHGHLNFKTCKTWQNGVNITTNCKPTEPILAGGLAEIILHNAQNYILFKPLTAGGNFTQIKFKSPCALPETNNVKGTFVAECGILQPANTFSHTDCATHEVSHLLQQASVTLFPGDSLLYGTKSALIDGIASVSIAGPELYAGASFGGHV